MRAESGRVRVASALAAHPHAGAAVLLAAVVIGYLWPVLFGGKVLSPGGMMFHAPPWRALEPADFNAFYNRILVDVPLADLPWRAFARELLREGTLPAWNPHMFAGTPFLANPQTGLYSLFSLPLWTLPFDYAVGLEAALKLWAAAFGTYLLVRQLGLAFLPGVLAGVAFGFSAFNVVWLTHATLLAVVALLPWMLWLVERILARGRPADALGLALATALALGGGHPGMQLHVLVATSLYLLLRIALPRREDCGSRARCAGLVAGGLGLGVAAMAVMLVPEALSGHGTIGIGARQRGGSLPGSEMPLDAIKTVAFPDWWGRPSAFELELDTLRPTTAAAVANYNERTFYAGTVALLLACVGLLSTRRRRTAAPFALLGALGLAVTLHAPGLYWLATHLPLLDQVQSQRLHFLFALGVAIGAAFGAQAVLERPVGERWRLAVPLGGALLALVAFVGAGAPATHLGEALRGLFSADRVTSAGGLALFSIIWFLLFTLVVGLALAVAARRPRWGTAIVGVLVLLAVADAYRFTSGYQPMARASAVNVPVTPAIEFLREHRDAGRFVGTGLTLLAEIGMRYGLDDVRGYSPPQPTERYYRLWRVAFPQQTPWQPFELDAVTPAAVRVLSVLGARWIAGDPDVALPPAGAGALRPLRLAYSGSDAAIYENPNALPRAFVAPVVRASADEASTRAAIAAPAFDPRRVALVEGLPPDVGGDPGGRARIVEERNARVTLAATLARPGLVVLGDRLADGWHVTVDGRTAEPLRVDDVLRGVAAGAGRHTIVWSYTTPGLRVGLLLSLAALMAGAGCAAALLLRGRRRRVRERTRADCGGTARG
jgi:hypothetical protein